MDCILIVWAMQPLQSGFFSLQGLLLLNSRSSSPGQVFQQRSKMTSHQFHPGQQLLPPVLLSWLLCGRSVLQMSGPPHIWCDGLINSIFQCCDGLTRKNDTLQQWSRFDELWHSPSNTVCVLAILAIWRLLAIHYHLWCRISQFGTRGYWSPLWIRILSHLLPRRTVNSCRCSQELLVQ